MTDEERRLLLYVARWVAEQEEAAAVEIDTTSNLAEEIRNLVQKILERS